MVRRFNDKEAETRAAFERLGMEYPQDKKGSPGKVEEGLGHKIVGAFCNRTVGFGLLGLVTGMIIKSVTGTDLPIEYVISLAGAGTGFWMTKEAESRGLK